MTERYCDCDLVDGDNDGTSWANAFRTFQLALDTAVASDIVYCKGTDTTAATIDVDTNSGTNAAGWIKFIGCNAAGTVDGTYFTIDANSGVYHALTVTNIDLIWFENIEIKNAGAGGDSKDGILFTTATATGWNFVHCSIHNCSGYGLNGGSSSYINSSSFFKSTFYLNTLGGVYDNGTLDNYYFCSFHDNTGDGGYIGGIFYGCIFHQNGDDGLVVLTNAKIINCVSDSNGDDGILLTAATSLYSPQVIGTRVTNQSGDADDSGMSCGSDPFITGWCYLELNGNEAADNFINDTLMQAIVGEDYVTTSNLESLTNTNQGYAQAVANNNFATGYVDSGDPDLRRVAITIPWT